MFSFPQIKGLGRSETARFYAIASQEEARSYMEHPVLGPRLIDCANCVCQVTGKNARDIFGAPDHLKLHSCMTLFATVSSNPVFQEVLDRYFEGLPDDATIEILTAL